jgi:hypothetical protein
VTMACHSLTDEEKGLRLERIPVVDQPHLSPGGGCSQCVLEKWYFILNFMSFFSVCCFFMMSSNL